MKPMHQSKAIDSLPHAEILSDAFAPSAVTPQDSLRLPAAAPKRPRRYLRLHLLAILATFLTTFGLLALNKIVSAEEPRIYVRPYTGLYILTILLMTWLGGRRLGFFTLGLCLLASTYFLLPPQGWAVAHPSDWAGIVLLAINAGVVVVGFDALQQRSNLVAAAEGAWQESARLAQETVEAQARLQAVVTSAQEERRGAILTQLLLPTLPTQVPGLDLRVHYEALVEETDASTPFFDSFLLESEAVALVAGRVAGSGLTAAATVAMLRSMVRSAVYRSAALPAAVTELNSMLTTRSLLSGPCRLFIGIYEASSQTLVSVSCGETQALTRRAETGEVQNLAQAGPPLGMDALAIYQERVSPMLPGDLLIFSPGSETVPGAEPEASSWKRVLEQSPASQTVQEWMLRLIQTGQENRSPGGDINLCLMAALITEGGAGGAANEN